MFNQEMLIEILKETDNVKDRVVVFQCGGVWSVGVLAFDLQADDFFYLPIELDAQPNIPESIAVMGEMKNPHGLRISKSDSGRTRTYNQLIKSQLSCRAAHCRKSNRKQIA